MKKNWNRMLSLILALLLCFSLGLPALAESISPKDDAQIVDEGGLTSNEDVNVSKILTPTDIENVFDITLTVKTKNDLSEIIKYANMDVVIVMDISESMSDKTMGGITQHAAAQNSIEDFINLFAAESKGVTAERNLAMVAFNTNGNEIFDLQPCKTEEQAKALISKMKTETNKIKDSYYDKDGKKIYNYARFTNIEAGLAMARDILAKSETDPECQYIVFVSDGFPTTYLKAPGTNYLGWDPCMEFGNTSNIYYNEYPGEVEQKVDGKGYFYNVRRGNLPTIYGTNYSDTGAERAQDLAAALKKKFISIFSIGINVSGQSLAYYEAAEKGKEHTTIETRRTAAEGYIVKNDNFKAWLKDSIGSGNYMDSTDPNGLKNAFKTVFEGIRDDIAKKTVQAWVVTDTMNLDPTKEKNIEFVGFFDEDGNIVDSVSGELKPGEENTASFSNDTLSWDVKNSGYSYDSQSGIYTYILKYRIRLLNEEDGFVDSKTYDTNGMAELTYLVLEEGKPSEFKEIDFEVPSVKGYVGEFTFDKVDKNGTPITGATFELVHNARCTQCGGNGKAVELGTYESVSDKDGHVSFQNIPSGHDYILREKDAPDGYLKSSEEVNVSVRYDEEHVKTEVTFGDPNFEKIVNQRITIWVANGTKDDKGGVVEVPGYPESKSRVSSDGADDNTKGRYECDTVSGTPDDGWYVDETAFKVNNVLVEQDKEGKFTVTDEAGNVIEGVITIDPDTGAATVKITNFDSLNCNVDVEISFLRTDGFEPTIWVENTTADDKGGTVLIKADPKSEDKASAYGKNNEEGRHASDTVVGVPEKGWSVDTNWIYVAIKGGQKHYLKSYTPDANGVYTIRDGDDTIYVKLIKNSDGSVEVQILEMEDCIDVGIPFKEPYVPPREPEDPKDPGKENPETGAIPFWF